MRYFLLLFYFNGNLVLGRGIFRQGGLLQPPVVPIPGYNSSILEVEKRQITTYQSTCGYYSGDPNNARTADPGDDCRVDTIHALWGFCPTTVIAATDCGLAGNCVDNYSCTSGCGITGVEGMTTFYCTSNTQNPYCSTVTLVAGIDQQYSYIACGVAARHETLFAAPTALTSIETVTASDPVTSKAAAASTTSVPSSTSSTSSASPTSSATSSATSTSPSKSPASSSSASTTPQNSSNSSSPETGLAASNTISNSGSSTTISSPQLTTGIDATNSPSPSNNNLGAIIGSVLGALALFCVLILGVLLLRIRKRDAASRSNIASSPPNPKTRWWNMPWTTEMQTAGLHEIEGDSKRGTKRFEKDGAGVVQELAGSVPVLLDKDGKVYKQYSPFELPCDESGRPRPNSGFI